MSQASDAIKEQRKQHRADHYTDADRALNGHRGKKARRAARQENFNAQGNKSAADFNFNQHGKGHVGGQEIRHLMQQGHSKDDVMAAAKASGGEIGKRAQNKFNKWGAAKEKAQTVKQNPIGNGTNNGSNNDVVGDNNAVGNGNIAAGGNEVNGDGNATGYNNQANTQKDIGNTSQTVTQDNDQTSTVNGDGNYVYQNQDNSVRNYGGDSRVFNYQGSGNSATDTPASMATMAGFFAPDDSHSANAARLDRQSTQNRDLQKAYQNTSHIAQGAITRANQNAYTDPAALDKRIANREQYNNAKSDVMRAQLFGDMGNFQADQWNDSKAQEKVEMPDYEEMYKKYSDF